MYYFIKFVLELIGVSAQKPAKGKVILPISIGIFGIIISSVFMVWAVITIFLNEPIGNTICWFVCACTGIPFIIGYCNCRISYNEECFTVKNFFGVRRTFTYEQITAISMRKDSTIYIGKYKVRIDELAVGGTEFLTFIEKNYRKRHRGKSIPRK